MPNRLADLKRQCQAMALEVPYSRARQPYLNALRNHYLSRDYPSGLPFTELEPMKAFPYWQLHPREQSALWKDGNNWIAQPKINGCRVILHFAKGLGVFAHGRTVNVSTFRRTELTDKLLFRAMKPTFDAVVDTEALIEQPVDTSSLTQNGGITKTSLHSTSVALRLESEASLRLQREQHPLKFFILDLPKWEEQDMRGKELAARFSYFSELKEALTRDGLLDHFAFLPVTFHSKRGYMESIIASGGEGVVLKNLGSRYEDNSSRPRRAWVKVKKEITFEAYVSGFEPGRPGSKHEHQIATLLFSINTEAGRHMIAKCSNIEWVLRKQMSIYDRGTGKVRLVPEFYGRVAQLSGFEFSARAARLVNPAISFWRSNKTQEDCVYDEMEFQALRAGAVSELLRTVKDNSMNRNAADSTLSQDERL